MTQGTAGTPAATGTRPPRPLLLIAILTCAVASIPLVYLLVRTGSSGIDDVVTILGRPRIPELLRNTIGLAVAVTASCVAIGVPSAFLLASAGSSRSSRRCRSRSRPTSRPSAGSPPCRA
jgi:ABC-type Fe3+ transport system permease subunit